jgi:hypothetical protein
MTTTPEFLSSDEACAYAGVTERTLRKWAAKGLQRFTGPTGRPTYRRDQLDEILARHKREPRPAVGSLPDDTAPPPPPSEATVAQNLHQAASAAQPQGDPQLRALLEQSEAACRAEEALVQAREEIRWLRERVEQSERERAELLRLILTDH